MSYRAVNLVGRGRGTFLTTQTAERNSVQGYLAHEKTPTPLGPP